MKSFASITAAVLAISAATATAEAALTMHSLAPPLATDPKENSMTSKILVQYGSLRSNSVSHKLALEVQRFLTHFGV